MEGQFSLRESLPKARFFSGEDVCGTHLVSSPSDCSPGAILAILSDCDDPAEAACEAMARGAVGILTEQILPVPLPQCVVPNSDRSAAELAAMIHDHPAEKMMVVGVVGGDGKTTTSLLSAAVLRGNGNRTAYETDLGCCDGVVQTVPDHRFSRPIEMAEFLAESRDAGSRAVVIELDDAFVRSPGFRALHFDVLVLTSEVSEDKEFPVGRVLDLALEQLRDGGVAIVNADSRSCMAAADRACVATLSYGLRNDANVNAKVFDQQPGITTLMVTAGDITASMETPLTGPAMASCQMAAIALGLLLEMALPEAIETICQVRTIPGRMQRLSHCGAPSVLLDRAGSSHRLRSVLRGLRRERLGQQLWVVAAVDQCVDAVDAAACGRVAEKYADRVVVTASQGNQDGFLQAAHQWLDGVQQESGPRLIANRMTAIEWVLNQAQPGDTVLVAGGWEMSAPADERAALACEVDQIETLQASVAPADASSHLGNPVILQHPAINLEQSQ